MRTTDKMKTEMEVNRFNKLLILLLILALPGAARAVEIKYAFRKGATYSYQYTQQCTSKSSAFTSTSTRTVAVPATSFKVKAIDFQQNAFILDIGDQNSTFRRYIRETGEIKGAPAETGRGIPFFLTFPAGDWKISEKRQIKKDLQFGNLVVPSLWNCMLKSVDSEKGLAEIIFAASVKLPDDQLRQKTFSLKGRALFNLPEGVIHQADWQTTYKFSFSNKEFAVTRNLWNFEQQVSHSLLMTGIQE